MNDNKENLNNSVKQIDDHTIEWQGKSYTHTKVMDSDLNEGIIAWLLFNLGLFPLTFYCLYLHTNKGRKYTFYGYLGKTSFISFMVLLTIEIVLLTITLCIIYLP